MTLLVVHYHLRPGGIRRIIELAVPHLVREAPCPITRVVLATGEPADRQWHDQLARQLSGVPVEVLIEPSFNYLSEQHGSPQRITAHIRRALEKLFTADDAGNCLVWAHNLGVGRNLLLSRELASACVARDLLFVSHHHDWWFDNRWARWPEMRRCGFRSPAATARAIFPAPRHILHAAINHADAAILSRHFGEGTLWLPNLTEPAAPPSVTRVRAAHRWLRSKLAPDDAPVWLLPCRSLRRKNIAEALLLTRWLRPEAWLVVTGAASSADERPYFRALEQAAHSHHWRLRLGVLAGDESRQPNVPELLAASEAVLLTSLQEGFGLTYLEAAAAHRPLIARRLPNIAPDLDQFGFRFPQLYDEILIAPELFDGRAECARQQRRFDEWRATLPAFARAQASNPPMIADRRPRAVPFNRLTLAAQLEVLAHPARETWVACRPQNPFLETWRRRATAQKLRVTPWPRTANGWLGGAAYASRFFAALPLTRPAATLSPSDGERDGVRGTSLFSPLKVQSDFIASKLDARNLYPLLWSQNA